MEQITIIEACARAAHEANRSYCLANGDASLAHWEDAEEQQRNSARLGVVAAFSGKTPRQMHESWMDQKRTDGWVYGEVKDSAAKTHPAFLPYDELPEMQRKKDELFLDVVRAMGAVLGAEMQPREEEPYTTQSGLDAPERQQ